MNSVRGLLDNDSTMYEESTPLVRETIHFSFSCFRSVIPTYVVPAISVFGIGLNGLTCLIMVKILVHRKTIGNMFKYLAIKSFFDLFQFLFEVFSPIYYCKSCPISRTYLSQFWYVAVFYYGEGVVELSSAFMELAATFDFFINVSPAIRRRAKWLYTTTFFQAVVAASTVYSLLYYTMVFFEYDIVRVTEQTAALTAPAGNLTLTATTTSCNSGNDSSGIDGDGDGFGDGGGGDGGGDGGDGGDGGVYYKIGYTSFYGSPLDSYLRFFHSFLRDIVILLLITVLNCLIIRSMKSELTSSRHFIMGLSQLDLSSKSHLLSRAERGKRDTKKLIVITGLVYLIGHVPVSIYHLPFSKNSPFWACYYVLSWIPFYISYCANFFIYFAFNSTFREFASTKLC